MAFGKEYTQISCPFCDNAVINVYYFPKVLSSAKGSWGGYKKATNVSRHEFYMVVDKECPNCHKTGEEIQKELDRDTKEKRLNLPTGLGKRK